MGDIILLGKLNARTKDENTTTFATNEAVYGEVSRRGLAHYQRTKKTFFSPITPTRATSQSRATQMSSQPRHK